MPTTSPTPASSWRFHVLGIPHTATNKHYLSCAYTQKVLKLCAMLKSRGHHVIHYGNEMSQVDASEHVDVTTNKDLVNQYGERWMTDFYSFSNDDPVYTKFFENAIAEIQKRKQPKDFLLCMWGHGHRPIADAHGDLIVVEPGIGYAGGHFAKWKVFESYAIMHAFHGLELVGSAKMNDHWYEVVIPNFFDLSEFKFAAKKQDYALFLGRVDTGKGVHIAIEACRAVGVPLKIAGPGKFATIVPHLKPGDKVEYVGFANLAKRQELLQHARAIIAPSLFIEPFCGVHVEAMLSGTPAITPDWGVFTETNLHGITGFRCRTFEHFTWSLINVHQLDPHAIRRWASQNFSMARVAPMYDEFFSSILPVYGGEGWYAKRPDRDNLDWLRKRYPS